MRIIATGIRKAFVFSGRAGRAEFWYLFLAFILASAGLFVVQAWLEAQSLQTDPQVETLPHGDGVFERIRILLALAVPVPFASLLRTPVLFIALVLLLIPMLSAGWRRLHDIGWPGWLIGVPLISHLLGEPFFFAVWFLMGDATPPEWLAATFAILFLLLSWAFRVIATVGLLVLAYLLSQPSTEGRNRYGAPPDQNR